MPVILNIYGFLMLGLLFGPMMATFGFTRGKAALLAAFFIGAALAVIADIMLRLSKVDMSKKLIHPRAGGHVFFIPAWAVSFVLAAFVAVIVVRRVYFLD